MSDQEIEKEIQEKGLTAARVTTELIEEVIDSEYYFTASDGINGNYGTPREAPESLSRLTFCVLVLKNGHCVIGVNYGAINPCEHSAETGKKEARKKAVDSLYEFLAYDIRSKISSK